VNPTYVELAAGVLAADPVRVCTVAGFPLGAHLTPVKAAEALRAIRQGAREVEVVLNIGALKSGDRDTVVRDTETVVSTCRRADALCKVILETAVLGDEEKDLACRLAVEAGAHFVNTSTGFAGGGATAEDVARMHRIAHPAGVQVKASGGIRTLADARRMIEAGASRIGTNSGVRILDEARHAASKSR
jgi:deoxyribose-phosphate aldolase